MTRKKRRRGGAWSSGGGSWTASCTRARRASTRQDWKHEGLPRRTGAALYAVREPTLVSDGHVLGGGTLGALHDVELNLVAFLQRLEPRGVDAGVMDEHVLLSILAGNEAEALLVVEPLHCSLGSHDR